MPVSVIAQQNLDVAKRKYKAAKKAYYNSQPLMTDAEFDALEASILKLDPKWKELHTTGVRTGAKKTEVSLERFMPSLNKKYPEDVPKWAVKPVVKKVRDVLIMDKLDGTSLQLVYDKQKPARLITRGDGQLGGDISFMLPWLVKLGRIPARIDTKERVVMRCEALMTKAIFEKKWASQFDNIRNMVNGLFNRQDQHKALADTDVVVLGVYGMTARKGLKTAISWGFTTVRHSKQPWADKLTGEELTALLDKLRRSSVYEMDGLVIVDGDWAYDYTTNDKAKVLPMAFKVNDIEGAAEVKLLKLIWQKTRTGRWQPVFEIPPTLMDGAVVTRVTGNNPAWLARKGAGVGAVVKALRSGGVIPKIVGVVKPAELTPPPGPYKVVGAYWMIDNQGGKVDPMVKVRGIHHFVVTMGIENVALKTIIKLHDCGLLKSTMDYVKWPWQGKNDATRERSLVTKAGLGPKQAQIINKEICRAMMARIQLRTLMVASGFFDGLGDRKLQMIEDAGHKLSKFVDARPSLIVETLEPVKGFSDKTIDKVVAGYGKFCMWYNNEVRTFLDVDGSIIKASVVVGDLTGKNFSWTGYRSEAEEQAITARGGQVIKYGTKTDVLFYNPKGKFLDKVKAAECKTAVYPEWVVTK